MKPIRASTLYTKILLWLLAISILPLAITAFFTYQHARTAVRAEIENFLNELADKQTHLIDNYMKERMGDVHIFAQLPIVKGIFPKLEETLLKDGASGLPSADGSQPMDSPVYLDRKKELLPIVQKIIKTYGYKNVYLISRNGDVIFSAMPGKLFGTNVFTGIVKNSELSRLVKTVLETKVARFSNFAFYPELNAKVAAFVAGPILQGENVIGVMALGLSPDNFYEFINDYSGLGKTGETTLGARISADGALSDEVVFVAPTRFDPEAAFKHRVKIGTKVALPMQNAVLEKNGQGFAVDYRGQPVWAVWRYLPSVKLGMVVKMDVDEINSRTETIKTFSLFLTLSTLLLVVGIAFRASKSIAESNRAEQTLKLHQKQLETLVAQRTVALENSNRELQQKEAWLRESKQRLNVVLQTIAGGDWEWDLVTDQFIFTPRWLETVGYSQGDLEPHIKTWKRLIHPDDISRVGEASRAYFAEETRVFELEYRLRAKSGAWQWRRSYGVPVTWDASGKPTYMIGADVDITGRKKAEEINARLFELFESTPDFIGYADAADTHILYINRSGRAMIGIGKDEDVTRFKMADTYPARLNQRVQDEILPTAIRDGVWEGEFIFQHRDGHEIPALTVAVAHKSACGKVEVFSTISRDITERKRDEEKLRASLLEKEVLMKELHHRTKNNMQVISSLISMQCTQMQNPKCSETTNNLLDRINLMAMVHENVYMTSDLSRIHARDYLTNLIRNLADAYNPDKNTVRVHIDIQDMILNIDRSMHCGLIIYELVSNCFKHAFPAGKSGDIRVNLRRFGDEEAELIVKDTGVGLSQELNIEKSESLGLQLVMTLACRQLKGTTEINGNNGTTFRIVFPRDAKDE